MHKKRLSTLDIPTVLRRGLLGFVMATLAIGISTESAQSQSENSQSQSQSTANPKPDQQEVPDAPSSVQPPPKFPTVSTPNNPLPAPNDSAQRDKDQNQSQSQDRQSEDQGRQPPPPMQIETVPPGTGPRNQVNPGEGLYKLRAVANLVLIPVLVKYTDGRRVDGLLPNDFTVLENGKKQNLTFFTSDPFQLSVAILIDLGMSDVAVQQVNQTYTALVGAFSPYDEVGLYTYSSTVSQICDFTSNNRKLTAILDQIKLVRGGSSGPPVLNGPLASGPSVNGAPVGGPVIAPVNTPPREDHVLNDAILQAAIDLSKRERTRRKVIFVISDGREMGSKATYRDVLRLLETRDIQVKAVVVDAGALPGVRWIEKHHIPSHGNSVPFLRGQGYSDILPKYVSATGGGTAYPELTRNSLEEMYSEITREARSQYTLGYTPQAVSTKAYRSIEILVDKKNLKIYAKDGYYPIPIR